MPYIVMKDGLTLKNEHGDTVVHNGGQVLSDWEVSEFVRGKHDEGVSHYTDLLRKVTDKEAVGSRKESTKVRADADGDVNPPFDDYVGLHHDDVVKRMNEMDAEGVAQVKRYENAIGGLKRQSILEHATKAQSLPFSGYDDMNQKEVLEAMASLPHAQVEAIREYEADHQGRQQILKFKYDTANDGANPRF
jgi:hypothetical protein